MPVAPGYQIKKEALEVHFVPGDSPHLTIHIEYILANIGSTPLHFIDVALPSATGFGSANFRARINGKEVTLSSASGSQTRIALSPDWRQKQKIALMLSYDLAAVPAADPRILVASKMFYLNDSGWFPTLLPFKAFLAPQASRPNRVDLSVLVPAGFRATASGQPHGTKKQNGELEYSFRIGKTDFAPYLIVGEYNEQRVSIPHVAVVLWTFKPVPSAHAQQTASQIARATDFYVQTFALLPKSIHAVYDIEIPTGAAALTANWQPTAAPPGAIINFGDSHENAQPRTEGQPPNLVTAQLAVTWFNHIIRPRPEAWILGSALAFYASSQFAEENGASRHGRIASTLSEYSRTNAQAVEKPVLSLTQNDPPAQRELAADKFSLFFAALEDKCGQQNVTHAIAHMVYALRGGEYGYPEFRSALEQQCHQDLSEFFRTWLAQPGIPHDFRAHYGNAGANGTKP